MELIPEGVQKFWYVWGIRLIIMLSLLCQIILTLFGFRRNRSKKVWMRIILWAIYTTTDWATKFCFGVMINIEEECKYKISKETIRLQSFWSTFLVLHLGGPDTITAYSLEDNELWLRSCFGMLVYVGVAIYIFLKYWSNDLLGYISGLLLFFGIVKYVERIWSLRSKSKEHLRDHIIISEHLIEGLDYVPSDGDENPHVQAYAWYVKFLCGFFLKSHTPLVWHNMHRHYAMRLFSNRKLEDAFKVVQIELQLVYQVLYTKATIFSSLLGILFRCIFYISVVVTVFIFIHVGHGKSPYQKIDIVVTQSLLMGTMFAETCSLLIIIFLSDWRRVCLFILKFQRGSSNCTKFEKFKAFMAFFMADSDPYKVIDLKIRSWSESMGQYNLIACCIKKATSDRFGVGRLLAMNKKLEKQLNVSWVEVTFDLRQLIFHHVELESRSRQSQLNEIRLSALQRWNVPDGSQLWLMVQEDLGHSILMWHIATDICYHVDDSGGQEEESTKRMMKMCRLVSDYMLYLYVMHPSMLGGGIIQGLYNEFHDEIVRFHASECHDNEGIYKKLLRYQGSSVLYGRLPTGCKLARRLQELPSGEGWGDNNKKWKMISDFWGEILVYASRQGDWEQHVHQLRRGGELLTYVRLLYFHCEAYWHGV